METLLSETLRDEHFHDASEHGLVWVLLNKMLHLIVFVFALFGMIRFKVKFIHTIRLVKFISVMIIVHSWYITIKFALMGMLMYLFSSEMELRKIPMDKLNCSLANAKDLFLIHKPIRQVDEWINNKKVTLEYLDEADTYLQLKLYLIETLDHVGGPYKMLGNRATLMYGFYAISIFIMLAIFPIELIYLDIGFNYIRFVLNDVSCLQDLYANKQKHLDRLNSWSRTKNTSMLTLSMKKTTNYRNSRCRELIPLAPKVKLEGKLKLRRANGGTDLEAPIKLDHSSLLDYAPYAPVSETGSIIRDDDDDDGSASSVLTSAPPSPLLADMPLQVRPLILEIVEGETHDYDPLASGSQVNQEKPRSFRPLRSLRHSWNIRHSDDPSYSVAVANKNLKKFKPHVRSETWFKTSMVVYPIFVFFYFVFLSTVIGAISIFFTRSLHDVSNLCARQFGNPTFTLCDQMSPFDRLTFYETQYCVFALSCASSFYCSYYFGTIIELYGWIQEISQQLTLGRIVLELTCDDTVARFFGPQQSNIMSALLSTKDLPFASRNLCGSIGSFDQFGGIENLWFHLKFKISKSQSEKFRCHELMAMQLVTKKQTLLRATYINMNLLFDELSDTRFMTQTILSRTTQIAFGFALMVAITRSQFESDMKNLHFLLGACLGILNLYLICAACINSNINKLLPKIHSLICASTIAETDHDLLEFWLRHIQAYGVDNDAMSYKILGYKVTWRSILNVSATGSSSIQSLIFI